MSSRARFLQNVFGGRRTERVDSPARAELTPSKRSRTGLIELFSPQGRPAVNVIFVHGLQGDPYDTWTDDSTRYRWIDDVLPRELDTARILTYGYESTVAFSSSVSGIEDIALALLNQVERLQSDSNIPIVFVAHSLGGIITKKALVLAHERNDIGSFTQVLQCTKAVAFIGVPHRGSSAAWWASFAANALRAATLATSTNSRLVKSLEKDSNVLFDIARQFVPRAADLVLYSFYELQMTAGVLIVDRPSAEIGVSRERLFSVNANHRTICKFPSRDSPVCEEVALPIVQLINNVIGPRAENISEIEYPALLLRTLPFFINSSSLRMDSSTEEPEILKYYQYFHQNMVVLERHLQLLLTTPAFQITAGSNYYDRKLIGHSLTRTLREIVNLLSQFAHAQEDLPSNGANKGPNITNLVALAQDIRLNLVSMWSLRTPQKQQHRDRSLEKLRVWNQNLAHFIERVNPQAPTQRGQNCLRNNMLTYSIREPNADICQLFNNLYTALYECWRCRCDLGHDARFGLNMHDSHSRQNGSPIFTFFVSVANDPRHRSDHQWQEGRILLKSTGFNTEERLNFICDTFGTCPNGFQLHLLMNDQNGQQFIQRLPPQPRQFQCLQPELPIPLTHLLGSRKMWPMEQRELALICSYSLLLFHGSPWLGQQWNKSSLSFFYNTNGEPEYRKPYIATRFENPATELVNADQVICHRNSNILRLGILLIEIFMERPIENWWTKDHRESVAASPDMEQNINLLVATEVADKMDIHKSQGAIKACLEIKWVEAGRRVSLEDADTRKGFYDNVIEPIEEEIEWILANKP